MKGPLSFRELFRTATCHESPYPYQEKLAREGFPALLDVPTGLGKTAAVFPPSFSTKQYAAKPTKRVRLLPDLWSILAHARRQKVKSKRLSFESTGLARSETLDADSGLPVADAAIFNPRAPHGGATVTSGGRSRSM